MAEISPQLVSELRSRTQAGIKDCKRALEESDGDMQKAIEWLRKRGITKAGEKADRTTAQGIVHSYIHFGSQVGVLLELNCETDFVAKREEFKELADNIAKQIAACPGVEYVSVAHIPPEVVEKERAIESAKDDIANKPPAVREKIVQGRIEKRLKEMSLLDQPYIKDQTITVDELIKQTIAVLKENIRVRRFVRYAVGEEIPGEIVPSATQPEASKPAAVATAPPATETLSAQPSDGVVEEASAPTETVSAQPTDVVTEQTPVVEEAPAPTETVSPQPADVVTEEAPVSTEAVSPQAGDVIAEETAKAPEPEEKPKAKSSSKKKKK
ncbi:MAG: translation elongation factor Ts [Pseudanabaenaceae cyanobacterium SKYGB_i_bin29]|nr:translation elongation factor Ts [Pseudanabaenaceae cyanobacterium SKYG29]MDW8422277.1 translation elongation factor Ts [Pseudanabaenaceae cyanobacterium SKYGB_i_bin29]